MSFSDDDFMYPIPLHSKSEEIEKIQKGSVLYYSQKPELLKEDVNATNTFIVYQLIGDENLILESFDRDTERFNITRQELLEGKYWYGFTAPIRLPKKY